MREDIIAIQTWLSTKYADEHGIRHYIYRSNVGTGVVALSSIELPRRTKFVQRPRLCFNFLATDLSVYMSQYVRIGPPSSWRHTRSQIVTLTYADPQFFEQLETAVRQLLKDYSEDLPR